MCHYDCFDPTCEWNSTYLNGDLDALAPEDLTDVHKKGWIQPATFRLGAARRTPDSDGSFSLFEEPPSTEGGTP